MRPVDDASVWPTLTSAPSSATMRAVVAAPVILLIDGPPAMPPEAGRYTVRRPQGSPQADGGRCRGVDAAIKTLRHGGVAGGLLSIDYYPELVANPQSRRRYLVSSLIEEAITSSQLEGATTTGRVAKEMIKSGRRPRTVSERMILNNYRAMSQITGWSDRPLSKELILELHKVVTHDTLENPADEGRMQLPGEDRVMVLDREDGKVLHSPPPAEELEERLEALCEFANGKGFDGFLHPVVRAILVHFWLAYDHPFADGNGRTARALFYWTMLRQGYWLVEFLSISRILRKAPAQYDRSFLYTESDNGDTTYVVLHQLNVIRRAIDELHEFLRRKMREVRQAEELLQGLRLNPRQRAVVGHALRNPDTRYTFKTHMLSHQVVYETSRSDLLELGRLGFLTQSQVGREFVFRPATGLADRLHETGIQRRSGVPGVHRDVPG